MTPSPILGTTVGDLFDPSKYDDLTIVEMIANLYNPNTGYTIGNIVFSLNGHEKAVLHRTKVNSFSLFPRVKYFFMVIFTLIILRKLLVEWPSTTLDRRNRLIQNLKFYSSQKQQPFMPKPVTLENKEALIVSSLPNYLTRILID